MATEWFEDINSELTKLQTLCAIAVENISRVLALFAYLSVRHIVFKRTVELPKF